MCRCLDTVRTTARKLARRRELRIHTPTQLRQQSHSTNLAGSIIVPTEGDYVLFLGCGQARPGDLDQHAREAIVSLLFGRREFVSDLYLIIMTLRHHIH